MQREPASHKLRRRLVDVALGREPAEFLIDGARLVDVYTRQVREGLGVAVVGDRIAAVGESRAMVGPGTRVLEARGDYLLPGFIDAHAHADLFLNPAAFAHAVIGGGTTTVLTEIQDIVAALGEPGADFMYRAAAGLPVRFYFSLPSTSPPLPGLEGPDAFPAALVAGHLSRADVLALGEIVSWPRLLDGDGDLAEKLALTLDAGRRVEGHGAGCNPQRLGALAAAGVTSCHEAVTAAEVETRLSLGLYAMLRHGSIRADLERLAPALAGGRLDSRRAILTPDWMSPRDLVDRGYMDYTVREAVGCGIDPLAAIQMATLNPATYLGLDHVLGGIAPGRYADLILSPSLEEVRPRRVIAGGRVVAEEGRVLVPYQAPADFPRSWPACRTPRRSFEPADFCAPAGEAATAAGRRVCPVIAIADTAITRRLDLELPVADGLVLPVHPEVTDLMRVSLLALGEEGLVNGFLAGFGARLGGLAFSQAHEHHRPLVVGREARDMAVAWERLLAMGGGVVLAEGGRVVAEAALPIGGLQSLGTAAETAEALGSLQDIFGRAGCPWPEPFLTLGFLAQTGLPFLRITPAGIYDVRARKIVFP